jgi:internalin A
MNIQKARERIQEAIREKATHLNLTYRGDEEFSDYDRGDKGFRGDDKPLTSEDLEELMPEILNIEGLTIFDAMNNKLSNISFLAKLKNLEILGFGGNEISDLSVLGEFKDLKELYFWENEIRDISPIQKLIGLKALHLEGNAISDISPITGLKNLTQLYLMENPALEEKIPAEILKDYENPQRIINYWLSITKGSRPLNEAKVVVVGQGSVGKTTLIERIISGQYIVPEKTDGIDIRKWRIAVNKHDVQLNIWDFGGQEIMHATHQFFLTKRSLYILALDCRLDKDENRLEYWLRKIESLSENSPVIIVGTKVDQHQFDLDQKDLVEKFPYIKGFYGISAKTGEGIDELKGAVTGEIGRLEGVHNELPQPWFDVKAKLEKLDEDSISYKEYSQICGESGVDRENEDTDLVELLHDLGVVLCFHRDARLQDTNVLQPEWVTNGVYKILNARSVFDNGGILRMDMLPAILDKKKYPKAKYRFILDMMKKFELCFEISDDEFLIPDLLKQEEPDTGVWTDTLRFQYQYEVFFSSIITRFIVRMHERIDNKTYWRNGVVLAYKVGGEVKNRALIKADSTAAKISIAVSGEQNTRRDFLSLIRGIFEGIHNTIPNLTVSGKVPVPEHENIVVDYNHLIALEGKGVDDHYPEGLTEPVSVKGLLSGINTKTDIQIAALSKSDVDNLSRMIGEIGEFFDRKMDQGQAELLKKLDYNRDELTELLNTLKSSGPKGKIKVSIPLLAQLGIDISMEKDFKPDDIRKKISNLIHGKGPTELKLKEGSEPKKLKE